MLFGHQDDSQKHADNGTMAMSGGTPTPADGQNPLAADPDNGMSLPATTDDSQQAPQQDATEPASLSNDDNVGTPHDAPEPKENTKPEFPKRANDDLLTPSGNDDLLNLKQQALQQLGPLVDHLDQTPEEKFRTTMMMIQSTDNQALVSAAYEAAQKITDDKVRAQALLDIVNEINYFTHQSQEEN